MALSSMRIAVAVKAIDKEITALAKAIGEVRRISHDLRPALLDDLGLPAALEHIGNELAERSGLEVVSAESGADALAILEQTQDLDIVLSQPHGGRSQTEGDALLALVTQGSLQAAIFRTDDLDATFEKVRASGAEVLQEPASQPWGVRDCAFRDPSGNLVRMQQA